MLVAMRDLGLSLLLTSLTFSMPSCAISPAGATHGTDFDWSLGVWKGVRRDVAGGEESPMTMRIEKLRTGSGQIRLLEIRSARGAPYRGVSVLTRDSATRVST